MNKTTERFQKWRGSKALEEQDNLNLALLISDYVDSVTSLQSIKDEAQKKFSEFNQNDHLSWGILVFTKLFIDEVVEQLVDEASEEKKLLAESSRIVSNLYDDRQNNLNSKILNLLENVEHLLDINRSHFANPSQYKAFIFSSYMLFHLLRLSLDNIGWSAQIILSFIVDLKKIKSDIARVLEIIEVKSAKLELELLAEIKADEEEPVHLNSIRDLLNKRYLRVLNKNALIETSEKAPQLLQPQTTKLNKLQKISVKKDIISSLMELEKDIAKISSGFSNLFELRQKKNEIEKNMQIITEFLNESERHKRESFLSFIKNYEEPYQLLLNNTNEQRKNVHFEKITQLKAANESQSTVGWVTSPLAKVYRTTMPGLVQDMIASTMPYTYDDICFNDLKELAKFYSEDLQEQRSKRENQIIAMCNHLFSQDERLKMLIVTEPPNGLVEFKKINDTMHQAILASLKLVIKVKENVDFLYELKTKSKTLNEFISIHDGIFVRICNFLARFFSFFKTETAKMIDEAALLKKQVDGLANEYQREVDQQLQYIDRNPLLSSGMKLSIKNRFNSEQNKTREEAKTPPNPNKHNVRILMTNLSLLFSKTPHPEVEILEQKDTVNEVKILVTS